MNNQLNSKNNFIKGFIDSISEDHPNLTSETKKKLSKVLRFTLSKGILHATNIKNGFSMIQESISRPISYCFFTAPMQSGKTNTFLAAIILAYYIYDIKIKSVFTSSLPRNKAFDQNKKVINQANKILRKEEGLDYDIVKAIKLDSIYKDLHGRNKVSKIQSFFDEDKDSVNLLFIDECHHGSGEESRLHQAIQKLIEWRPDGKMKFIFNSATNYDPKIILSQSLVPENNCYFPLSVVTHAEVSNSYYGLESLLKESKLQEIESGSQRKPKNFIKEVQQLIDHAQAQCEENYAGALVMVRMCPSLNENKRRTNNEAETLRVHLEKYDPDTKVIVMNSTTSHPKRFDVISEEIKKGKVVCLIVTGYLSASDDLGNYLKTHVAGVIENFKSVQGIAQGLIGRILGHNIDSIHRKLIISRIKFINVALALEKNPDAMRLSSGQLAKIIQEQGIAEAELYENRIALTTNSTFSARSSFVEPMRKFIILPKTFSRLHSSGRQKNNESVKEQIVKKALDYFYFHNNRTLSWTDPYIKDREGGTAALFMTDRFRSSTSNRAWPLNDLSLIHAKEEDLKGFNVEKYNNFQNEIANLISDPLSEPALFSKIKDNIIEIDSDGNITNSNIPDSYIQSAFVQCRIMVIDGTKRYKEPQVTSRSISKSIKSKSCLPTLVHEEIDHKRHQLELGLFL